MVAPQQDNLLWVLHFITKKELNSLYGIVAPVYEVSDKNVLRLWQLSSHFKQFDKIMKLAMDIPADRYGGRCFLYVGLLEEELFDFITEEPDTSFV